MRRAQAFGGSSPSASVVAMQQVAPPRSFVDRGGVFVVGYMPGQQAGPLFLFILVRRARVRVRTHFGNVTQRSWPCRSHWTAEPFALSCPSPRRLIIRPGP